MVSLSEIAVDPAAIEAKVRDARCGAVLSFVGLARDSSAVDAEARRVVGLEYEAYAPMALQELARIEQEAVDRWPGVRIEVVHRVGVLAMGDVAVVVAVAAPHRAAAFEACRHVIEALKQRVPIFKRERYDDGASWVGNRP